MWEQLHKSQVKRQKEAHGSLNLQMFTERPGQIQRTESVAVFSLQSNVESSNIRRAATTHQLIDQSSINIKVIRFQLLTCEYVLVSFLLCVRKLNSFNIKTFEDETLTLINQSRQ